MTKHNKKLETACKMFKNKHENGRRRELRAKVSLKKLRQQPGKSQGLMAELLGSCAEDLAKHGLVKMQRVRVGKKRKDREEQSNEAEWAARQAKRGNTRALSIKRKAQLSGIRGDRRHFTSKALLMQVMLKREANMAAGRIKGALDVVCNHMFTIEVQESWASETTILRTARLIYKIELIQLREHLKRALYITVRWDLSPQAHKEMLAVFISASFLKADTPPEFKESARATGTATVDVFNFVLCLQQCANKRASTVLAAIQHTLGLVGLTGESMAKDGWVPVTSDGGSENKPALTALFTVDGVEHGVMVYCAGHALSLVFSWACNHLPGKPPSAKPGDLMTHRSVVWAEKMVNLTRRHWQSWDVYTRAETGVSASDPKPNAGVRTRWLCIIDCAMWIMPRLKQSIRIIRKYYLKQPDGKNKFQLSWQKVYTILHQKEFLGFISFLCVWGEEFFKPALKWIEHEDHRGFRAPEMPAQVHESHC